MNVLIRFLKVRYAACAAEMFWAGGSPQGRARVVLGKAQRDYGVSESV